jgi:lysophospholipase L1-like esterase
MTGAGVARRLITSLLLAGVALAQTPVPAAGTGGALTQKAVEELATRILQLIESTAVVVPGLVRASQPIKENAQLTFSGIERAPQNPALIYQFMNQVKAYLALADSLPRPYPFPAEADRQYAELREGLQRMQQHFEAILQVQNLNSQQRDADPDDLKRYAAADAALLPPGKLPRVVFLGDSITDYWRLNEYFTGRDFVNRGIAGQTTLQMLGRFRPDVIALNPKAVVILAGTNDIGAGYSAEQTETDLMEMVELARAHNIKPALASVLPVSDYHKDTDPANERTKVHSPAAIQALNHWMQGYCATEGLIYIDYYSALVDSAGKLQADASDDGLHPNARGYRLMSPIALESVGRVLSGQTDAGDQAKRRFRILGK